jgi:hypothetical protein
VVLSGVTSTATQSARHLLPSQKLHDEALEDSHTYVTLWRHKDNTQLGGGRVAYRTRSQYWSSPGSSEEGGKR